ncbi:hypothetical protein MKX01_025938 [Papaver californicum]|nr:hypothetical protein MKX01_025938 [Papaver californicum]
MKSNTKPSFRGLRVKVKAQAPEKHMSDYVYRQNFTVRSFEIGPNRATIGALLNHLQARIDTDSIANHIRDAELLGDGFGSTPEMTRRNLIWVVAKMHGGPISFLEVRGEMAPITMGYRISEDIKLSKLHDNTSDFVQTGLTAHWSDLDVNHHVNIAWVLENTPTPILKGQELFDLALQFRRECREGDELKSLTTVVETGGNTECQHMLQLENGNEVMRGRTKWRPNIVENM